MKKKALALLFCLLLVVQLAMPAAKAENLIFFTAMGESILPMTDETMPFISGNSLFIPSSIFTGSVRKALDVSYSGSISRGQIILYSGSHSLWFDLTQDYATDEDDNVYYPGAIVKNGQVFIPSALVARFFDLRYSITEVEHGYMMWMRKQDYALSDTVFADAASYIMESRYKEYLKTKEQQQPSQAPTTVEKEEETVMDGKRIYLCFQHDESTSALLDTLDRASIQAAVFFTPEDMAESGDTLRRMITTGHSVGIQADAASETPLLEQLAAANDALEDATCTRTRLVMVQNSTDEAKRAAEQAGYCVVTPNMDRTRYGLRTSDQAEYLVRRISDRQGSVTVWLGTSVNSTGLRSFLTKAAQAEGRCRALTETA